ncbi:unnamed protein product [Paramecium sonneborni]|uniref:Uncharacterized protein n=1 Tax=Paramecium sonneborni TaxID=65129 RepID=A0A8S1RTR0_9CILI|nr:unnamed protein product [Paramecium sonneborni]
MAPHFFKLYYNICSIFQLNIIGTINQKQIISCQIDKYLEKQYLTISVEAFIEQSFKLKELSSITNIVILRNQNFYHFQKQQKRIKQTRLRLQMNNQLSSQILNYDMESQSIEILFSQRECIVNQIPNSVEGRFINQQDDIDDLNIDQVQQIFQKQIQNDKISFEKLDQGDHQRQSNQQKSSKIYQSSKDQLKQDKYFIDQIILYKSMIQNNQQTHLIPLFLQLAMNHIAFSKLLITEKKEQKVKNKFLGLLDQKQANSPKILGYEFICVNNVQDYINNNKIDNNNIIYYKLTKNFIHLNWLILNYIYKIKDFICFLKWMNYHKMLINNTFLFLRESNVRKNESIEDKVLKNQSDSLHYIYYYYCFLSQNEANLYLSSAESNNSENQLYTLMQQLLKLNIIFGLNYELKHDCQNFMRNIRKSDYQLFIYRQNQEISATSFLFQSQLLQQNDIICHFNQQNEEDLRAYFKQCLEEFSNQFSQASINSFQFIKICNDNLESLMIQIVLMRYQEQKKQF